MNSKLDDRRTELRIQTKNEAYEHYQGLDIKIRSIF